MEKELRKFLDLANREEVEVKIVGEDEDWDPIRWQLLDVNENKLSFHNKKAKTTKVVLIKESFPNHYVFALFLRGRFKGIVPMFKEKVELENYLSLLRRYYLGMSKEKREYWQGSINKMEEVAKFFFRTKQNQKKGAVK